MEDWIKKYLILFGILIISIFVFKYILIYLTPFILAIIFASLIDPIVNWLEKNTFLNRGFSVIIVLVLAIAIIVTFILFGISQSYLELNRALKNLPDYNSLNDRFKWFFQENNQLTNLINELKLSEPIKNILSSNLEMIYENIKNGLISFINTILSYLSKLPMFFTILFLSFIATFFISKDKEKLNKYFLNIFPDKWKPQAEKVRNELINSAIGFIRAQLILISITGVISWIGLMIIGSQYSLIIAVSAAILDLIPIIGPALMFYPLIIYNIIIGHIGKGISLFILHIILAAIRSGSEGKIVGKSLGIYPLSTMIALYAGFRIMGLIGFIVGPAVLVLIKAFIQADLINIIEE
ncbi:MAG TPA: sporulation integral membrane protein YtvI [Halanaerobiales bacterium]|nr:sporulation integral membrane protein YtvI [Halanaerobiales bacterium]